LEWEFLVYCSKCGTKNEEDAEFCVKCGASLTGPTAQRRERRRREKQEKQEKGEKPEQECFGLPHGSAIIGVIIGAIVILWGISSFIEIDFGETFWPLIIIVFGILIVAGALYQYGRKR
jgi:uncharacterized membrane protein YvbJ